MASISFAKGRCGAPRRDQPLPVMAFRSHTPAEREAIGFFRIRKKARRFGRFIERDGKKPFRKGV